MGVIGKKDGFGISKPMLTAKDKLTRLRWWKERINWSMEKWEHIFFKDESKFELINSKSKVFVKRFKSETYTNRFVVPKLQGGARSFGIWGCFYFNKTGLHIFTVKARIEDNEINLVCWQAHSPSSPIQELDTVLR